MLFTLLLLSAGALLVAGIDTSTTWDNSYDYIIIGAGTAGCVVTRRLSDDADVTVLLLEAGNDSDEPFLPSLRMWLDVFTNPEVDWGFKSNPQPMHPDNMVMGWPQAKMLGGCTSHNAHVYTRGSPHDFDRWAEMGNKGWSYKDVFQYFLKSESMQEPSLARNGFHGVDGPLRTHLHPNTPVVDMFIKAGVDAGLERQDDYHAESFEGIARGQQVNSRRGQRMTTFDSFVRPKLGRRNLDVLENAHVTKMCLNGYKSASMAMLQDLSDSRHHIKISKKKKVEGVYFFKDGQTHYVEARREVIVSGGAINSPKLLMLSGIGPRKHLEDMGIDVIADLPVGNNLEEHIMTPIFLTIDESTPIQMKKTHTFQAMFEYVFDSSGPWATAAHTAFAFYKVPSQPKEDKFPYIEQTFALPYLNASMNGFAELLEGVRNGTGVIPHLLEALQRTEDGHRQLLANTIHLHPKTRGTVRLDSTDPMVNPAITHNFLDHAEDIKVIVDGLRMVKKMVESKTLRKAKVHPLGADNKCLQHKFDSDAYWECYVIHNFQDYPHYCCTNRMSPGRDGVVDNRLRVKGVAGLRVADTSILPMIPSGHPVAPTVMVAEKCADMIKEDNQQRSSRMQGSGDNIIQRQFFDKKRAMPKKINSPRKEKKSNRNKD